MDRPVFDSPTPSAHPCGLPGQGVIRAGGGVVMPEGGDSLLGSIFARLWLSCPQRRNAPCAQKQQSATRPGEPDPVSMSSTRLLRSGSGSDVLGPNGTYHSDRVGKRGYRACYVVASGCRRVAGCLAYRARHRLDQSQPLAMLTVQPARIFVAAVLLVRARRSQRGESTATCSLR